MVLKNNSFIFSSKKPNFKVLKIIMGHAVQYDWDVTMCSKYASSFYV